MEKNSKIYVAGHEGLVGSSILRELRKNQYTNLITAAPSKLDLRRQSDVEAFFAEHHPEYVFLAAGRVGGIVANNTRRAEFIYDNVMIVANIVQAAFQYKVRKLLNLGSSCIYPRNCSQPMLEEYLLTGILEKTNEPYAVAKIAGMKLVENYNFQYGTKFISLMPTNLYGPNDNFDLNASHVLPALLRRFHEAKQENLPEVILWGTGVAKREFMHVDDLARACLFAMNHFEAGTEPGDFLNVGTGIELSIRELAEMIKELVGYQGEIIWDKTKPDGTPRKLLDVTKINSLGWSAKIPLNQGLLDTYKWYCSHLDK